MRKKARQTALRFFTSVQDQEISPSHPRLPDTQSPQ